MGNRAVITTVGATDHDLGIYLHWNGGPESVLAFCEAAKQLGVRPLTDDPSYGFARLTQIIGNFFGGTNSVGVGTLSQLDGDNHDNGTYYIGTDWQIVRRTHAGGDTWRKTITDLDAETAERYAGILAEVLKKNAPHFKE